MKYPFKNIFNRKAVTPEEHAHRELKKAVKKHIRGKRVKRFKVALGLFLASVSTTAIVHHLPPDRITQSLDDYMVSQHLPVTHAQQHYHVQDIRVYERGSISYPFHDAGRKTKIAMEHSGYLLPIAGPILGYTLNLAEDFTRAAESVYTPVNAYSLVDVTKPVDTRDCYIYPAGKASLLQFVETFSDLSLKKFTPPVAGSEAELEKMFITFVALHEARHCDQDTKRTTSPLVESDADMYALKVMEAENVNPTLMAGFREFIENARVVHSMMSDDAAHATSYALHHGKLTLATAYRDRAGQSQLVDMANELVLLNTDNFSDDVIQATGFYHVIKLMDAEGLFEERPALKESATEYIKAYEYFDKASGGQLINKDDIKHPLDIYVLGKDYKPVPDKLQTKPPSLG